MNPEHENATRHGGMAKTKPEPDSSGTENMTFYVLLSGIHIWVARCEKVHVESA